VDAEVRRRFLLSLLSIGGGKLVNSLILLIQVPVFLHYWAVPLYGEWLLLSTIPAYFSLSDLGFGTAAGSEMTMLVAAGRRSEALRVFQSVLWLIVFICLLALFLLAVVIANVPLGHLLGLREIGGEESQWVVLALGGVVLLGQIEVLLQGAYASVGRKAKGSLLKSGIALLAFGAAMAAVALGEGPAGVAAFSFAAEAVGAAALALALKSDVEWIGFGWTNARWEDVRRLSGPAISFMSFPIGNALNLQGTVAIIGFVLGPTSVVIFSTTRTVSRLALQAVQVVNFSVWPELSRAFGAGDVGLAQRLHRRSCQISVVASLAFIGFLLSIGPWFIDHWTGKRLPAEPWLLLFLLLGVAANALWSTSSAVQVATNRHQGLALRYLVANALVLPLVWISAREQGLVAVAAALIAAELVMNTYVLPDSLKRTHDTIGAFLGSLMHVPPTLRRVFGK